jgi:hypothetical protein
VCVDDALHAIVVRLCDGMFMCGGEFDSYTEVFIIRSYVKVECPIADSYSVRQNDVAISSTCNVSLKTDSAIVFAAS